MPREFTRLLEYYRMKSFIVCSKGCTQWIRTDSGILLARAIVQWWWRSDIRISLHVLFHWLLPPLNRPNPYLNYEGKHDLDQVHSNLRMTSLYISVIASHKKTREKQEIQSSRNKVRSDQTFRYPDKYSIVKQQRFRAILYFNRCKESIFILY